MSSPDNDKVFTGSVAQLYESYLVPLIFQPYASDLAHRLACRPLSRVLEIAAGTGVVTRNFASPLRNEIETRSPSGLGEATDLAAHAFAQRFGRGAVDGKIQAHIVSVGA